MKTINPDTWDRKEAFTFFNSYETPLFNICANVTITNTHRYLEKPA